MKVQNQAVSQGNSTKCIKRANTYTSQASPRKLKRMEHSQVLPESTINLIPKQDKDNTKKKENYRSICLVTMDTKIVNKILAT